MPVAEPPAYVQERADDYALVEHDTGAVLSAHPTLRGALDAALSLDAFGHKLDADRRARKPYLRDAKTGEPNGVYRWVDSTAEEAKPASDGIQVTAGRIRSMIAHLAAGEPIPFDGGVIAGLAPSNVHGQLFDSGTLARGWAHTGVEWRERVRADWPRGRIHLAMYAELLPPVARAMDTGELALGSIGFKTTANGDDATALQYALTNRPIVQGLQPAGAMRSESTTTDNIRFAQSAARRFTMPAETKTAARATIADDLKKRIAVFAKDIGVDAALIETAVGDAMFAPATSDASVSYAAETPKAEPAARAPMDMTAMVKACNACLDACKACIASRTPETITACVAACKACSEACKDSTMPEATACAKMCDVCVASDCAPADCAACITACEACVKVAGAMGSTGKSADAPTARAVDGLDGPALDAFASDVITVLRAIFGDPAALPAALLDSLKAAQDGIKGMLAGGAAKPADGAPGDQNAPAAGRSADVVSMRAELTRVSGEVVALRAANATLEAKVGRADLTVETARAFTAAGRIANERAITEAVEMQLATSTAMRARVLELAINGAPPAGEAMPNAQRDTTPGEFTDLEAACVHFRAEIKREAPALSEMDNRTAAFKRAREAFPHLT